MSCARQHRNEVLVLGTIHGEHLRSEHYGIARLKQIIKAIDPDYILTEIPPSALAIAQQQFRETGAVEQSRVRRFPEYVNAVFPLQARMHFEVIACAAWTEKMARERVALLGEWKLSRRKDSETVDAAMAAAERAIANGYEADDPQRIHSEAYDRIVKEGMTRYSELFGDDLGPGGWQAVNQAHYALIEGAIAAKGRQGGKRFLVIFGAWHKYWFLEQLRRRSDLRIIPVSEFL